MNLLHKLKRFIAINFPTQKDATKRIISFWEKGGADFEYYESADREDWLKVFWDEKSVFYPLFKQLDTQHLLEIACGTGRHSAKVIANVERLYLLESSREALNLAKDRFKENPEVTYIYNPSGFGIPEGIISDGALTGAFSYDAMVHFEREAVESYVRATFRKLKPGGYALFHHSNYDKNPGGKFTDNPGWRNHMTQDVFTSFATATGFEVIHSEVISFSCPDSDCVTLLRKP